MKTVMYHCDFCGLKAGPESIISCQTAYDLDLCVPCAEQVIRMLNAGPIIAVRRKGCATCGGTGHVERIVSVATGHPTEKKIVECDNCGLGGLRKRLGIKG